MVSAPSVCSLPGAEQIIAQRLPLTNVNEAHAASLSTMERLALWTSNHVGTMGSFLVILA